MNVRPPTVQWSWRLMNRTGETSHLHTEEEEEDAAVQSDVHLLGHLHKITQWISLIPCCERGTFEIC